MPDSSRQQLELALDVVGIAVWELELPATTIRWHRSLEPVTGPLDGGLPATLDAGLMLVHDDDRIRVQESVERAIQGALDEFWVEFRIRRADDTYVWIAGRGRPVRAHGSVTSVIGIAIDATARAEAEEALAEREQIFRAVFDNAADAMLVANDDARYVDANPAACELLGRTRLELTAMSVHDLSIDPDAARANWEAFLARGSMRGDWHGRAVDGSELIAEVVATANITPGLHLWVLRDVTERRAREQQLAQLTEREHEVLELMCEGMSTREIASQLFLEPGTVRTHIAAILRKLDVGDRTEAIRVMTR